MIHAAIIPASNEPSSRARADIWRMPRGALRAGGTRSAPTETECRPNTPQQATGHDLTCCVVFD